ncbi:MAG: hypothetical protein NTY64_04505, partial [Deltaproteobacteria bacterium]|nr:hypothetical protein [Deltaproteobacteria bacterium]
RWEGEEEQLAGYPQISTWAKCIIQRRLWDCWFSIYLLILEKGFSEAEIATMCSKNPSKLLDLE